MVQYIHGAVKADTSIYDQADRPDAYTQMPHMLCLNSNRWRVGLALRDFPFSKLVIEKNVVNGKVLVYSNCLMRDGN